MLKKLLPLMAALVACVCLIACPVFATEVDDVPAVIADDMHESTKIHWTVDGDNRSLGVHWGVGYHDVPVYVTWDNGIVLVIDYADTSPTFTPSVWVVTEGWLTTTIDGTLVEYDDKSYYYFDLGDSDFYGLDCSSLFDFRNSLNLDKSHLYYLADDSFEWNKALNFVHLPASTLIHFVSYDVISTIFDEVIYILPVIVVFMVASLAVHKGVKFIFTLIRSA